jgi:hypothetical protein
MSSTWATIAITAIPRAPAMDEPAAKNQPLSRSYLALRDIEATVDHIKRAYNISKVTLIRLVLGRHDGRLLHLALQRKTPETRPLCTALQFTRISGPAADCRISASRAISTSRSAPIVSRQKPRIPRAGMARYRSTTRTNIPIPHCPSNSGRNAWRRTRRAIRALPEPARTQWRPRAVREAAKRILR